MVEKLNVQVVPHPKPYKLHWIIENGELSVDKQVEVKFSIGNYKDKVLCDVVPMEACHILLDRPWQFDKKTLHNGLPNEITFTHKQKKFVLNPLPHSQVVRDQIQMKHKRDEMKKKRYKKRKSLGIGRGGRRVFLPTRLFNKINLLKTLLKICFLLNNLA